MLGFGTEMIHAQTVTLDAAIKGGGGGFSFNFKKGMPFFLKFTGKMV
jgi:hypothetical protein